MKNLLITTTWLFAGLALFSQTDAIEFIYDDAGNRKERHVIELKAPEKSGEQSAESQESRTKSQELQNGDKVVYKEQLGDKEISIFPIPTKGWLTVSIRQTTAHGAGAQGSGQTNGRIEVYSLAGEKVFQKNKIRNKTNVDLSNLRSGTYILKIMLDSEVSTWKIIKE